MLLKHIYGIDALTSSANNPIHFDTLIDLYLVADRLNVPSLLARIQQDVRRGLDGEMVRDTYNLKVWEGIARVFGLHSEGFRTLQRIIVDVMLSERKLELIKEPEILKERLLLVPELLTMLAIHGIKVGRVPDKGSQAESRVTSIPNAEGELSRGIIGHRLYRRCR